MCKTTLVLISHHVILTPTAVVPQLVEADVAGFSVPKEVMLWICFVMKCHFGLENRTETKTT